MLRSIFSILLLFIVTSSILAMPAYSIAFNESGLLLTPTHSSSSPPPTQHLPPERAISSLPDSTVDDVNGLHIDNRDSLNLSFNGIINMGKVQYDANPNRDLVFGSGNIAALAKNAHLIGLGGSAYTSDHSFLGLAISKSQLPSNLGFTYSADSPLQFYSVLPHNSTTRTTATFDSGSRLSGSSIVGSDAVAKKYNINGTGVKVAIVDTGTDFANPDMNKALARDENGVPIMLDADGQGLVLTRAKYVANIDKQTGIIQNTTYTSKSDLPKNITSYVYVNKTGTVFLRVSNGNIPVYNSLYPYFGAPVLNATSTVDWIIGKSPDNYIRSASGIYHFGIIFQTQQQFGTLTFALVPVLVIDSQKAGVYDTIIPDMYSAWYFYTHQEIARIAGSNKTDHLLSQPSFDFTDDSPIRIGKGNEFLVYDYNKDGFPDFSAGAVGARVVDLWQVISNNTKSSLAFQSGYGGVATAKLLEPLDPAGNYFGVMYDEQGHGSSTAATVASRGIQDYDIYKNGTKYKLAGIAPGAKIIPVKALWAGDALYGWLYVSGFEVDGTRGTWKYQGASHRADIVSNSWGVSSFPILQYGQGYDILSMFSSLLSVPNLLADNYPGIIMVNSIGNDGLGYGSVGSPNSAPLAISVGATTNNVHVGFDGLANLTRFGDSNAIYDQVASFSSRGPGLFGDPKPELMAVGEYGFTPAIVNLKNLESTKDDPNNQGAFTLFGGTSMATPMVAGSAALVIQDLRAENKKVDPFTVKNILMSSAKDLKNDPFVQGSGRVDALAAIDLVEGKSGKFSAYTQDTASNILSALKSASSTYNTTFGLIEGGGQRIVKEASPPAYSKFNESRWFAGYIEPGSSASTNIIINNPSRNDIGVSVSSNNEKLVARYEIHNATQLRKADPLYSNTSRFGYIPNYYNLQKLGGIPKNADLMVVRLNFPFEQFMNMTDVYGNGLRIASIYGYDWNDTNRDGKISFKELSLVSRGGSWGTVQEMRISDPCSAFKHIPLLGVYPVPTLFSFWQGDTRINATSMNYTLTVEFYQRQTNTKDNNNNIVIKVANSTAAVDYKNNNSNSNNGVFLAVPAGSTRKVEATIKVPADALSGVYSSWIIIKPDAKTDYYYSDHHTVLMPVSYVVTSSPVPKDLPVVFSPDLKNKDQNDLGLRPNGYVGGLFDMVSRYSAGDWRSYYYSVKDPTINTMSLRISWPHNSTSINAMLFGPDGKMVSSSVPAGIFEKFAGWPSNDWLGTNMFSEGGAFYFSQNNGRNSTILQTSINQTGIYSLLIHNTLFHGNTLYEPVQVEAKFSTLLPDDHPPVINVNNNNGSNNKLPIYFGNNNETQTKRVISASITDDDLASYSYAIDAADPVISVVGANSNSNKNNNNNNNDATRLSNKIFSFDVPVDTNALAEGLHKLRIEAFDSVGHTSSFTSSFEVDKTPPNAIVMLDQNGSIQTIMGNNNDSNSNTTIAVSKDAVLSWNITDKSGVVTPVSITAFGSKIQSKANSSIKVNSSSMPEGEYHVSIKAEDMAGNKLVRDIKVIIDRTPPTVSISLSNPDDVRGITKIILSADDTNLKSAMLEVGYDNDTNNYNDILKIANVTGIHEYYLDTSKLADGKYNLKYVASDVAGNRRAENLLITVKNTMPAMMSASLTGIAGGAAIASAVWFFVVRQKR